MRKGFSFFISLCSRNHLLPPPPSLPSPGVSFFSRSHLSTASAAMPGADSLDIEWPAKRVRDTFVKFFEDKNHVYWKSSPVVPFNDPTLLFANAGTPSSPFLVIIILFHSYSQSLNQLVRLC